MRWFNPLYLSFSEVCVWVRSIRLLAYLSKARPLCCGKYLPVYLRRSIFPLNSLIERKREGGGRKK